MHKKILLVGSGIGFFVLLSAGFFALSTNAQALPPATCSTTTADSCAVGNASGYSTSGGMITWVCTASVGTPTQASCSYSIPSSNGGTCGSSAYTCQSGSPINEGNQYAASGDYYYWACQGANNGSISGQCTAPDSAGSTGTGSGGASCSNNVGCAYGDACLSGSCTPVRCTTFNNTLTAPGYSCGNGFTCNSPDTAQASCVANPSSGSNNPPGSPGGATGAYNVCSTNSNCNTFQGQVCLSVSGSALGQCGLPNGTVGGSVSSILPAADQALCTGPDAGTPIDSSTSSVASCNSLFFAQAQALGYDLGMTVSQVCTVTVESTPAGSTYPNLYTPTCTLSGTGVLGALSGSYTPQTIVGQAGLATSNSWYLLESGSSAPAIITNPVTPPPTVTPPATTPSATGPITGIQGYNPALAPSASAYTSGNDVLQGTYIVLYGNFAASGNIVSIDGSIVVPSYQSATQINVPISAVPQISGVGQLVPGVHYASVSTPSNVSGSVSFTVVASSAISAPGNTGPSSPFNDAITNALAPGASQFAGVLSHLSAGLTANSGGSTSAPTPASTGGTCASSAATTVASSLQTLQGLDTVLTSGNVSAGVLTSVQNLINAVAQVLSALSSCISAGN